MKKISLLFGIHMHQPVDNFDESVDEAVELCYGPFFETMLKYPDFKFAVHCSGWLFEYIRIRHKKIFDNMKKLTEYGSIEWVSAGYYEPVLSSIPSRDRQAQISKLNNYIYEHLGSTANGLWLTERVWETAIIPDLDAVGIRYAIVDDYHFLSSGFEQSKMDGYYVTEEGGDTLALFPISQSLRYSLPFNSVEEAIESILECYKEEDSAAIIFDDAEKFGLWPKTHEWVYGKKWLEKFVEAVLKHEKIKTEHYSKYLQNNRSRGIAYINNTSYFEMGEWSLKYEQTLALEALKENVGSDYFKKSGIAFIKGGIWKNFFVKYHESNYLHKRMLECSIKQDGFKSSSLESLYKMQTNDVFWHGIFGGIYLPHLRDNAYRYLLEIEREQVKDEITFEYKDIDKNGYEELKVLSKSLSTVISSRWGAQMIEFGSLDKLFNWQNTLMRRKEAYHENIFNIKEIPSKADEYKGDSAETIHCRADKIDESLKDELIYDWHPKHSFIDHLSLNPFELESFRSLSFCEVGDFANHPFEFDPSSNTFMREGWIFADEHYKSDVKKRYTFKDDGFTLDFRCDTAYKDKLYYAMECNFHFAHPQNTLLNGKKVGGGLSLSNIDMLIIEDTFTHKKITLSLSRMCNFDAYILNTLSQSENGFERVAQQISLIFSLAFERELNMQIHLGVTNV